MKVHLQILIRRETMLLFMFICLLISIPCTSMQDELIPSIDQRRPKSTMPVVHPMEKLLQYLTEQQYQYETAFYALAMKNVFPNFAQFFHERSESKCERNS